MAMFMPTIMHKYSNNLIASDLNLMSVTKLPLRKDIRQDTVDIINLSG